MDKSPKASGNISPLIAVASWDESSCPALCWPAELLCEPSHGEGDAQG